MSTQTATAKAFSNIAFIKYWGNRDETLRLPVNGSISMNLAGLETRTSVTFSDLLQDDSLTINGRPAAAAGAPACHRFSQPGPADGRDAYPRRGDQPEQFSQPAPGSPLPPRPLRPWPWPPPKPPGSNWMKPAFPAWPGAVPVRPAAPSPAVLSSGRWAQAMPIRLPSPSPRPGTGIWSIASPSSPVKPSRPVPPRARPWPAPVPCRPARVADAPRRLEICRNAILQRDFAALAEIVELDSNMMHAVMMTSHPALFYWQAATLTVMQAVQAARAKGLSVCYTIDAGPMFM